MAETVRLALIACQRALWPGPTLPGSPEMDLERGLPGAKLDEAYWRVFERRVAEQRLEVLNRAADFVYRDPQGREVFLRQSKDTGGSDVALREALRFLAGEWDQRSRSRR